MFWRKKKKNNQALPDVQSEMADTSIIKVVIKTDLGNVRTNNEDMASFHRIADGILLQEKGYLLIMADGMGGYQAGEVASKMAVEIIGEEYYKDFKDRNKEKILSRAFVLANKKIFDLASSNGKYKGMGTTCTAIVIDRRTIYYAHVGDSRAYLYRNKLLQQLTEDHTYVQQLVKSGEISLAEAETHPQRNILTNAMGTKPNLRVDTGKSPVSFEENDRLLLCSDGLYDYMTDEELANMLTRGSLEETADYLVDEAKRRGGKDNITLVLAEKTRTTDNTSLKLTRDVDIDLSKLTRDADLPADI